MSAQFRFPPSSFVKHDDLKLFETNTVAISDEQFEPRLKNYCNKSAVPNGSPAPLRDGHIVLLAVDVLVALHASFKKWRKYRRTLRALDDLDEHQLRDIGLTLDENGYRALGELDEMRRG